jgi:hypothetical protein
MQRTGRGKGAELGMGLAQQGGAGRHLGEVPNNGSGGARVGVVVGTSL